MIAKFDGKHRFLNNFWPVAIHFEDATYHSVECAYQAAKTLDPERRVEIRMAMPGRAKHLGQLVTLRSDWNEIKLSIMHQLVAQKFCKPSELQDRLLATGDQELVEGNYWRDTFWGVCRGIGENHLGRILMKVRSDIKECVEIAGQIDNL